MKGRALLVSALLILVIFVPLSNGENNVKIISYEWDFYGEHFKLNMIVNGTEKSSVSHFYNFWTLNISVPYSAYEFYHRYPGGYRIGDNITYLAYFSTPNDTYIREIAHMLNNISVENEWNRLTEANFILTFVQSVPYVSDFTSTGYVDYYKFPLETLIQRGGDCEDKALLLATIMDILNYNAILFVMQVEYRGGVYGHVAVGLDVKDKTGPFAIYLKDYYVYHGVKYYYMESTGSESMVTDNWSIKVVHYWVGISPTEADAVIKNLSFVPLNTPHYQGYTPRYDYVKEVKSTKSYPWYVPYALILSVLFLVVFLYSLKRDKKKCPACGYALEEDYLYCPNCGYWLNIKLPPPEFGDDDK